MSLRFAIIPPALSRRLLVFVSVLLIPVLFGPVARAQEGPRLEDRILAVVDEDPILQSDVDRAIGLGFVAPHTDSEGQPTEATEAFKRRVLERLIEQRLRFHTVESFGFEELSAELVDGELENLRRKLGGAEELDRKLDAVDLGLTGLRQLLARQLEVLTYIEERLGPRIFIRREEVQVYYQEVLVPELTAAGSQVPALDDVRETIRQVLREQRLNEEIANWTTELRSRANVELFLEPPGTLPPVVSTQP